MSSREDVKRIKALADENRLAIMLSLQHGEKCACVLLEELNITQPTLSHHMKLLCDSNLVKSRKEGKWMHYSISPEGTAAFRGMISEYIRCDCENQKEENEARIIGKGRDKTMENTKLYILTGFLGSGKTTVLLELCRQLQGKRIGIIQNELGKINIDGKILRDDDIKMVELNRGSIFCTCLKLNFVQAMAEMSKEEFDYLFVESSGWGDPSNVHELIAAAREISDREYDFCGVICFVDALNFPEQIKELETAQRQLKHCNLAVITKTDLVDSTVVERVSGLIREINPFCEILTSAMGQMDYSFLRKDITIYQWTEDEESTNSAATKPKTLFLEYDGEVDGEKLKSFLRAIAPMAFRVKGFCLLADDGWTQVDMVGDRIDYKACEPFLCSQLVLISKVGPQIIRPAFAAWEEHVHTKMCLKN